MQIRVQLGINREIYKKTDNKSENFYNKIGHISGHFYNKIGNKSGNFKRKSGIYRKLHFFFLFPGMFLLGSPLWNDLSLDGKSERSELENAFHQLQSELVKVNSLIYAQQNNFFQLHLGSKELQTELEAQKTSLLRLMGLYMRNGLKDSHAQKTAIVDSVDRLFADEMIRKKMDIERRIGFHLMNLKQDAYEKLLTLQNHSMATLTVHNITHNEFLNPFMRNCKSFQRDFTQQIHLALSTSENLITNAFNRARKAMEIHDARETDFEGFSYTDIKEHLLSEHQKHIRLFKERLSEESQKEYVKVLGSEYGNINSTYASLLSRTISNYTTYLSYEYRFQSVMKLMANLDLKDGKYVWRMNSSMLPLLPEGHGYYSEMFTAIPTADEPIAPLPTLAKLWIVRTSVDEDAWKITYEQDSESAVRVNVAILNQLSENDLVCPETYRHTDESNRVIIDFDVPINGSELVRRGFIYKETIFMRSRISVV